MRNSCAENAPFLPKDIFEKARFLPGLTVEAMGEDFRLSHTESGGCYMLPGEFAKCYEVKFAPEDGVTAAFSVQAEPDTLQPGISAAFTPMDCDFSTQTSFMYVCRSTPECLLICISGDPKSLYIGERTILQDRDTAGPWFIPAPAGDLLGGFADYRWSADAIIERLYEPYRQKYPDRVRRTRLGKDQTGNYDMYGYIFAPPTYRSTIFITGGVHGNEESGYFALAKLMQLICDATPDDALLYTLRENVRFIVVPVVNVWGVSQDRDHQDPDQRKRCRRNGENVDLNRDFGETTQAESRQVLEFFRSYAADIDIAMDLHCSGQKNCSMWYNFINHTVNSHINYKTTNHMYHRLMSLGLCEKVPFIGRLPGRYFKSSVYLEGRIWNEFQVPTITVENVVNS